MFGWEMGDKQSHTRVNLPAPGPSSTFSISATNIPLRSKKCSRVYDLRHDYSCVSLFSLCTEHPKPQSTYLHFCSRAICAIKEKKRHEVRAIMESLCCFTFLGLPGVGL